jgi:hypothetical protein
MGHPNKKAAVDKLNRRFDFGPQISVIRTRFGYTNSRTALMAGPIEQSASVATIMSMR